MGGRPLAVNLYQTVPQRQSTSGFTVVTADTLPLHWRHERLNGSLQSGRDPNHAKCVSRCNTNSFVWGQALVSLKLTRHL